MNTPRYPFVWAALVLLGATLSGPVIAQERVDILVVYTPAARAYAGSTNAMKAAINTYVAATNTAYANSDINVDLRLVSTAEVAYTESGDMSTDLARLRSTTDAYLTPVAGLRDQHKADLVCLIRRDGVAGVAGIGYLSNLTTGFASSAYSVVADIWAVGNNSFPHETGHNFGCQHDHANGSGAARSYAYGYRFNGTNNVQYRTIMAYAPGTRISYFSNPSISYAGTATGVSGTGGTAADNARLIEESSVVTSSFRNGSTRLGGPVVGDLNNDGAPDLLLSDASSGERYGWLMSGTSRSAIINLPTMNPTWEMSLAADFNGDGRTDIVWSNTVSGARTIWLMNGTTRTSTVDLATMHPTWRIAGTGDFDHNGCTDIVWENTVSGVHTIWLMNRTTRTATVNLPTRSVAWRLGAVADFNADGNPDLAWDNTVGGEKNLWLMNGTSVASTVDLAKMSTVWRIVGAGDFTGDGKPDIVWENAASKARNIWSMNGTVRTGTINLPAPGFD